MKKKRREMERHEIRQLKYMVRVLSAFSLILSIAVIIMGVILMGRYQSIILWAIPFCAFLTARISFEVFFCRKLINNVSRNTRYNNDSSSDN